MTDWYFDPALIGGGDLLALPPVPMGTVANTTAWPGGSTLGATPSSTIYTGSTTLGATLNTVFWPPEELAFPNEKPAGMLISDDFETGSRSADWERAANCDCRTWNGSNCTTTGDLHDLDALTAAGDGSYFLRMDADHLCLAPNASCRQSCEWNTLEPNGLRLGETDFICHQMRVNEGFVDQDLLCSFSQPNYQALRNNALGIVQNLTTGDLVFEGRLGYSGVTAVQYVNDDGWRPFEGDHPISLGEKHDYIWQVTYSTIIGTKESGELSEGGITLEYDHLTPGRLALYHRLPETTFEWTTLYDSITDYPDGAPTRQWGYLIGYDAARQQDDGGFNERTESAVNQIGNPRTTTSKIGYYRGSVPIDGVNNNDFTVDHFKFGVTDNFNDADQYLRWDGIP